MRWFNEKLYESYDLIGEVSDNTVELYIKYKDTKKPIKTKFISSIEIDNINLDDIRLYFSRTIHKIKSKNKEQIEKLFGDKNG